MAGIKLSEFGGENLTGTIGTLQLLGGYLLPKGQRPKYSPPGAAQEALTSARMMANTTVRPGNEYAVADIQRNAGMQINNLNRTLNSGSQVLAGVGMINNQTNSALRQNNAMNAQFKFNAFQNLQRTLQNYAQYQDKAWQWNQQQPYMDRMNTKAALIGSGLQNINNWNNFKLNSKMWENYMGGQSEGDSSAPQTIAAPSTTPSGPVDNSWKERAGLPTKIPYGFGGSKWGWDNINWRMING